MEFFIRKNSTLPIIKVQIVKDGRVDFREFETVKKQLSRSSGHPRRERKGESLSGTFLGGFSTRLHDRF